MNRKSFPHLPAEGWELFLRDELSGPSLLSVESHLDGCAACRQALEAADPSRLFRRLRGLPVKEEALAGLWESVRAEIQAPALDGSGRPGLDGPARTVRRRERVALFAGAATLALAAVLLSVAVPDDEAARSSIFRPEPCVQLALSSEECRGLFVDVSFDAEPPLVVAAAIDLSELL